MGKTPPRGEKKYWTDELTNPFCTIADMEGKWVYPQREGVTAAAIQDGRARKVAAGSLMMSFKLTIGRVGFAGVDLYQNEAIVAIDVDTKMSTKDFLYLVLGSQDLTHGSGRAIKGATLNSASLAAIPLALPPLAEQTRIIDVMAAVDTYIAALQQQADDARAARNAVLHELLTAGGDDWSEMTLGDVTDINPENTDQLRDSDEITYIDLSSVSFSAGISADLFHGSYRTAPGRARRIVRKDDVLISTVRPYLKGFSVIPQYLDGAVASTGFCVLRAKDTQILPGLVWAIVSTDQFVENLMSKATGSSYPAVRPKDVAAHPIALPPLSNQKRIVGIVSAMDEVVSLTEQAVIDAHNLHSGLLSNLLSGEHEIPETYDRFLGVA